MSAENSIVLVTNDNQVEEILKPKLVLLREIDTILTTKYPEAVKNIKANMPDAILLHCSHEKTAQVSREREQAVSGRESDTSRTVRDSFNANEQDACLNLIKEIKADEILKNMSILLIIDEYDQDFILNAYDENISDYMTLRTDDAEILMRTIWCLKENSLVNTVKKQHNLLKQLNVIDSETGFYSNKFCDKVFENEFGIIKETDGEGILMAISPSEESKTKFDAIQLAQAIKNSTRNSDIISHGPLNKFYVFLPKTPLKGAFCVWDKIKKAVGEENTINAGVSSIEGKSFEELKGELLNALIEAESTKNDLIVVNREESSSQDWLDKINSTQKNFKLFKQAFNKKLDKVITPVFFQVQKLWEEKLYNTQIDQYSNSTLSAFSLKTDKNESDLKITYPGFSKINIDIIHQGLDSPENKRISLDLTELDENRLTGILEDFIQEFKEVNSK